KAADDTYRIEDFSLTTCDNEAPSWSITGSEIKIAIGGYGTLKNAAFRIKDFPAFYLPYMIFPAKTKRQTGLLLPLFDRSSMNGYGIEIPFFWAISDASDITLYERYMSKRGIMHGLEFRYAADADSKGEFLFDILNDKIEEKDLTDRDQAEITPFERTNQRRYWLRGRVDQSLSDNVTARLDLDFVSDQDYLREFAGEFVGFEGRPDLVEDFGRPMEERYSSFRKSSLRVSRDGEDYSLQGSGYYYQSHHDQGDYDKAQPIAGLFYSLLPEKLYKLPLFFTMDTEYNYLWRDKGISGHTLSVSPEFSYPKQLGNYLKLDSCVSYTGNLEAYDAGYGGNDGMIKDAYQARVSFSTVLERIFNARRQDGVRLKHKITPSIVYGYVMAPEDEDQSPWFDPIDSESKTNMIGLSVENLLDASITDEKGGVSYRQWARLDITQRYDLNKLRSDDDANEDGQVRSPLLTTLILRPIDIVNLKASTAWDHYEERFSTTTLSADFSIPRSGETEDSYYIDYVKYDENNKSLNLQADVKLLDSFRAGGMLNRDLDQRHNIHRSLWVQYSAQCWSVNVGFEEDDTDKRYSFKFRIVGF
ncbi:MAG: LPS-assembly protein LptD, partial [Deltaproteobacteria bacterium]|nr:LPS-assembly protein LptD [Deltaproteobacteria bacterium]